MGQDHKDLKKSGLKATLPRLKILSLGGKSVLGQHQQNNISRNILSPKFRPPFLALSEVLTGIPFLT